MTLPPIMVITGPPGVGKTTMVHKLVATLGKDHPEIKVNGFYTTEMRKDGSRTGFEVVTMSGQKALLATKSGSEGRSASAAPRPRVGAYSVDVAAFELLALPLFKQKYGPEDVLIIDEVGRMELLSQAFSVGVQEWLLRPPCPLVLTLPSPGRIPLVERIRKHPHTKGVITLNVANRGDATDKSVLSRLTNTLLPN